MATKIRPCCPTLLQRSVLSRTDAGSLAALFKALADPMRLRLLSFIAAQDDGEACVCHLIPAVGLSQPTVSHHLKVLHDAGLVERERRGTWVYYRVSRPRLEEARAALATRAPAQPAARRA